MCSLWERQLAYVFQLLRGGLLVAGKNPRTFRSKGAIKFCDEKITLLAKEIFKEGGFMKFIELIHQNRRDITFSSECECCGAVERSISGYDDDYFWRTAFPKLKCKKCGKSTIDLGEEIVVRTTKYPEEYVV